MGAPTHGETPHWSISDDLTSWAASSTRNDGLHDLDGWVFGTHRFSTDLDFSVATLDDDPATVIRLFVDEIDGTRLGPFTYGIDNRRGRYAITYQSSAAPTRSLPTLFQARGETGTSGACLDRFQITVDRIWNGCKYSTRKRSAWIYGLLLI